MILGVDVSSYQSTVDWPLLKAHGVEFAIVKISQGMYITDSKGASHAADARATGMVVGLYHFLDTRHNALAQAQYALGIANQYSYDFLALDIEELANTSPTPIQISETARTILDYWKVKTTKPLVIYSRANYMADEAYPMLDWALNYPLWLASYPFKDGREVVTWEELVQRVPANTAPYFPRNWPDPNHKWLFWQFSGDKFVTPGLGLGDYNFFNGTLADLKTWASVSTSGGDQPVGDNGGILGGVTIPDGGGGTTKPVAPTVYTGTVVSDTVNIRSGPNINLNKLGSLKKGDTFPVLDVSGQDVWLEIAPNQWVCMHQGNTVLVEIKPS